MADDIVNDAGLMPVTAQLESGESFVVCSRRECVFHAGEVRDHLGDSVPACGRGSIEWDGDEGECKDYHDSADVKPGDLEMFRSKIPGVGSVGPWVYQICGEAVMMDTFVEASEKVTGIDPRFPEVVRELAKHQFAPPLSKPALEEARMGRDRNKDIESILKAAKDAKPGDVIVFDEFTGGADVMSRAKAKGEGYKPIPEIIAGMDAEEYPLVMCKVRHDTTVISPMSVEMEPELPAGSQIESFEQLADMMVGESKILEVDGVRVEECDDDPRLKERVSCGVAQELITAAVVRDVCDFVDEVYMEEAMRDPTSCSECVRREHRFEDWSGWISWDDTDRPPPCAGKRKWLGINRCCSYFLDENAEMEICGACGGLCEYAGDGVLECNQCGQSYYDSDYEVDNDG